MIVIGLTGPSGAGKGEAAKIFTTYKMDVIDADAIYHSLLVPPSDCLCEIADTFGDGVLNPDKTLNRAALASLVFGIENFEKLSILNSITHKYVCIKIRNVMHDLESTGKEVCVIDAPLLIESGLFEDCDFVICILADKETRINRIMNRDNISADDAKRRVSSQKDDEFYISYSDAVVINDGDFEYLKKEIDRILAEKGVDFIR